MPNPLTQFGVRVTDDAPALAPTNGTVGKPAFRPAIASRRLSDVDALDLEWLIPGVFPAGCLSLLVGNGGVGKSFAALSLAATLSRGGVWPNGERCQQPGTTILLSAEDDASHTIRPRLDRHGADPSKVFVIDGVTRTRDGEPRWLNLADDVRPLEDFVLDTGAKLIVVDPVGAYMADTDSHRDSDTRSVLGPMASLAERTGVAVCLVAHLNKSASANAAGRVCGSVAFVNSARMAWLVGVNPSDDSRRVFCPFKSNVIEEPKALGFSIVDGRVEWAGASDVTAEQMLTADTENRSERDEAVDFLVGILASGPLAVKEIRAAAESEGHAWRTVVRAKKSLGVRSDREGYGRGGCFRWSLPEGGTL